MPKARASFVLPALAARPPGTSLRRGLTDGLRRAIEHGELAGGVRLPSSRELAEDLGVSRGVVTDAYAQLAAEGWIDQRPGARPVVRALPRVEPVAAAPPAPAWRYDLTPNAPDLAAFPRGAWVAAIRRVVAGLADAELDYPDARGPEAVRRALAGYLGRTRGAVASADRMLVVQGFTHGLAITCRVLAAAGSRRLAVEDPSLDDGWETIRRHGLEPVPVPVDGDGIVVDALAATGGNRVQAAQRLGIARSTLLEKVKRLGIQ
jgi:GntR family transcriptional regulator/MocR family aminotransferase